MRDRKTCAHVGGRLVVRAPLDEAPRRRIAIEGVTGGVAARRGRIGAVLGGVALVGVLAAGFVFWRKRSGKADGADHPSPARRPSARANAVSGPTAA